MILMIKMSTNRNLGNDDYRRVSIKKEGAVNRKRDKRPTYINEPAAQSLQIDARYLNLPKAKKKVAHENPAPR